MTFDEWYERHEEQLFKMDYRKRIETAWYMSRFALLKPDADRIVAAVGELKTPARATAVR